MRELLFSHEAGSDDPGWEIGRLGNRIAELEAALGKIKKIAEEAIHRGNEACVDDEFIDIQRTADECLSETDS